MKTLFENIIFRMLFYPFPKIKMTKEEEQQFNDLFTVSCKNTDQLIEYNLSAPKYKFLHYLACNKAIVLHGSNHHHINAFEPRQQTLFNGELTTAVFCFQPLSMTLNVNDFADILVSFGNRYLLTIA